VFLGIYECIFSLLPLNSEKQIVVDYFQKRTYQYSNQYSSKEIVIHNEKE